jgi:hypothetical protein
VAKTRWDAVSRDERAEVQHFVTFRLGNGRSEAFLGKAPARGKEEGRCLPCEFRWPGEAESRHTPTTAIIPQAADDDKARAREDVLERARADRSAKLARSPAPLQTSDGTCACGMPNHMHGIIVLKGDGGGDTTSVAEGCRGTACGAPTQVLDVSSSET